MAFISTAGAIGIICGFAGIFAIIFLISCIYWRRKNPAAHRRARRDWVRERQAEVRRQRALSAEEQRKVHVAMRMNENLRHGSRDGLVARDLESGVQVPPPVRMETLPSYERALDVPPAASPLLQPPPPPPNRAGSESSVPSYTSRDHAQVTPNVNAGRY